MKHAYKSFLLENESPVKICGDESLYALQNTSNNTVTLQGSNTATAWVNIIDIPAGTTKHVQSAFAFLKANGELHVNRAQGSLFNSSLVDADSNPLPVSTPDGLAVSGTATSAEVLFTTSMLNYESITVQVTSAGTGCTITYETSDDNLNWVACSGLTAVNSGSNSYTTTSTTALILQFARKALYFRARVSTYGSGTVTVAGTLSKNPVMQIGAVFIVGGVSSEGSNAVNPITIAAEARTSSKASVANGTLVRPIATVDGRQIVRLDAIPENEWSYVSASGGITNTTTPVDIAGGAGSGIRNYVTSLQLYSDTLGTATEIVLRDGIAGSILWRSKIGTAGTVGIQDIRFHPPIRGSTNTIMQFACVTATGTGSIYVNAQGYKAP